MAYDRKAWVDKTNLNIWAIDITAQSLRQDGLDLADLDPNDPDDLALVQQVATERRVSTWLSTPVQPDQVAQDDQPLEPARGRGRRRG